METQELSMLFTDCKNTVVKYEILNEIWESLFHTLRIGESTDNNVTKMLIINRHIKFSRPGDDHKKLFAGIVKYFATVLL